MSTQQRTVIVHYHIYKNSGTSFDHVLSHSFADRHEAFDGPYPFFRINQTELDRIIMAKPQTVAFSSHQTLLPQPASMSYRALAAVFVRHPILRIGSIYRFKRQTFDGTKTSRAAIDMDFPEWLNHCFGDRAEITHISNAQTRILGAVHGAMPLMQRKPMCMEYDLVTAMRNLRNVEFLGRTEYFDADVSRFVPIAEAYGITLTLPGDLRQNVTETASKSVEERLAALLDPLPTKLRECLIAANQQDLALYEYATQQIEQGATL